MKNLRIFPGIFALLCVGSSIAVPLQNPAPPASRIPPLTEAVWKGDLPALKTLLLAGADPDERDDQDADEGRRAPWMWAIAARDNEALALLFRRIQRIKDDDLFGQQRLPFVAAENNIFAAKELLKRGVPVDVRTADGSSGTALMIAAASGYTDFMKLLLDRGANVKLQDKHKDNALMAAVRIGSVDAVRLLISHGADPNQRDEAGRTALIWAARSGRSDIAKILLDAGADANLEVGNGRTALTTAAERGYDAVVQLLRAKGVREAAPSPRPAPTLQLAVEKSLFLLGRGWTAWVERAQCQSCHHEPMIRRVIAVAKQRGFSIDAAVINAVMRRATPENPQRRALAAGTDQEILRFSLRTGGDPSFGNAWFQSSLIELGVSPDATREANAILQTRMQLSDGRWRFGPPRVPIESSDFTSTASAVRLLQTYGPPDRVDDIKVRIARAKQWLIRNTPTTTDDKVFKLLGLYWTGTDKSLIAAAANVLKREQNVDGGWSQLRGMNSDAYATGLVLVALRQAGHLPPNDLGNKRGVDYLLRTQEPDGSWLVHKRANPINPYFESGFPHGKFQFISFAGTCWATMALMYAAP